MLLVGFGAALRRSELIALDLDDITITQAGLTILVRRSKTEGGDLEDPRAVREISAARGFSPRTRHEWGDGTDRLSDRCAARSRARCSTAKQRR